jgi:putative endonuclease
MKGQPCSVYAISSLTRDYIYVGLAFDPAVRIDQHQRGSERTTKPYRPIETLVVETHANRTLARSREKYLKSGAGKEFLKELSAASRGRE